MLKRLLSIWVSDLACAKEMEVKEEEEDYDDGSQDDGMLTDEDSFKKPNGGLTNR